MTVSIAHLSDPHISHGLLAPAPAAGLHAALGRVLTLDPRPDCVVITGDLVDQGRPEEYRALRELIERFPMPMHLLTGNHDDREGLLAEFGGSPFMGGSGAAYYSVDYSSFTVIALDSKMQGSPAGQLGGQQLAWLDTVLARRPQTPAIVCLHHPPIDVGIPFLDGMRLSDGEDLAGVLVRHSNVARVLAGHVHRPIAATFAGTTLAIAPSTHLQSRLALEGTVPNYVSEPSAFLLHLLAGSVWVTHTVSISHAAAPIATF
ncbi:phosphodiesterase [Sinomonas albida]|uniref:phosphodiesterase n=1 Tax=Sinomonas albida TaxID=369942 RepID=UPI00301B508D